MTLDDYIPVYMGVDDYDIREHRASAVIGAIVGVCVFSTIGFAIAQFLLASGAGEGDPMWSAAIITGAVSMGALIGAFVGAIMGVAFVAGAIKPAVAITWVFAIIGTIIGIIGVVVVIDPLKEPLLLLMAMLGGVFIGAIVGAIVGSSRYRDADMIRGVSISTIGQSLIVAALFAFVGVICGSVIGAAVGYAVGAVTSLAMGAGLNFNIAGHGAVGGISVSIPTILILFVVHAVLVPLYEE